MVNLTHRQISSRIQKVNKQFKKNEKAWVSGKISQREYESRQRHLVQGKLFPLQKAGLVLSNPHIYGYKKKSISLTNAKKLYHSKDTGGTKMTDQQFYAFYGFKPRRRKK